MFVDIYVLHVDVRALASDTILHQLGKIAVFIGT